MKRPNPLAVLAMAVVMALSAAPIAGAQVPHTEGVPSFGESAGCGALDGVGGPLMGRAGTLAQSYPVYGPWGDFYGRTIGDIWSQLAVVNLPGLSKDLYVHERVVPAFDLMLANLATEAGNGNTYPMTWQTWSYNNATIPPGRKLSYHAAGAAIDINSNTNLYSAENILTTDMPQWYVDAWRDAGWCWGGDWQTIKDAMHYSWMGPIHTPGYDLSVWPRQAPKVAYTGFEPSVQVDFDVVFDSGPADGAPHFVIDVDADGAPDVVRLRTQPNGKVVIEVARARYGYHWSVDWARTNTPPSDPSAPVAFFDVTSDARPDLVYLIDDGFGELELQVFPLVQGSTISASTMPTGVPVVADDVYLFDDYDLDGATDLYVIHPGSPGSLDVWMGPTFDSIGYSIVPPAESPFLPDSQYATGYRDFDWVPDVFGLQANGYVRVYPGGGATPYGVSGTANAQITSTSEDFFVGDLDGDGHSDLLLVDAEGDLRMRRGGYSTHAPGVWFQYLSHRVSRYFGSDRYATAAAISKGEYPDPDAVDVVFIATGESFADALSGAAAAGRIGAPLLLVPSNSLPQPVRDELIRLGPSSIVVLGGTAAVSDSVLQQLESFAPTTRLSGTNRYTTAVAISQNAFPDSADQVVITTGTGFADALSGASAAVQFGAPILLTDPGFLPSAVATEIQRLDPSRIVVLGGTSAVSGAVFTQLQGLAPTIRIAGSDRYQTAIQVSQEAFPGGAPRVFLATGVNFPDALAGAAAAAYAGDPILLVPGTMLPSSVQAEIDRLKAFDVVLLGGAVAIDGAVASTIEVMGL